MVANIFNVLGIPVFDADSAAKKLMNTSDNLKQQLVTLFGDKTYTPDGALNKKFLADIVFSDSLKLEQLNAIVHPATIAAAEEWMLQQKTPYAVKEAALLFESGSAAGLDVIIGVVAPTALKIKRVMERDGITREAVLQRRPLLLDGGEAGGD